jgi:prepilin-type N-terminal cleavage/methylation domain-containing protein
MYCKKTHQGPCKRGFTFAEVIISMSLFLILAGVGVGAYFRYYSFAQVDLDVHNVMALISKTRFLSQKNPTSSDYGIHFDPVTQNLTLYKNAYVPYAVGNETVKLDVLRITDLNLNPVPRVTNSVLFERQSGKTINSGTVTFGNDNYTYTISINPQGVIN